MVENNVKKGEIACYKQFLLFSQCCPQLHIFSASECGRTEYCCTIAFHIAHEGKKPTFD